MIKFIQQLFSHKPKHKTLTKEELRELLIELEKPHVFVVRKPSRIV